MSKGAQALASLLLLGVTVIVFSFVAELATRVALSDVTTTGDNASYFARRWTRDVEHNEQGFREGPIPRGPRAEGVRIIALGDSLTYGQGVDEAQRFSERIEATLNAGADGPFEVLNFGRPGAATTDELETLRTLIVPSKPDFVLLQWFPNDVEPYDLQDRPTYRRLIPSDRITAFLHQHSALYYLVNSMWIGLQDSRGWVEPYDDYLKRILADPQSPSWLEAKQAFADLVSTCRAEGIELHVVLFPKLGSIDSLQFLHARLLDQCEALRVECLDLTALYGAVEDSRTYWVNRFDPHPGAEAHGMAAEALVERFGARWRGALGR